MTEKENQHPQIRFEASSEPAQSQKAPATADEFSANVQSENAFQLIQNIQQDNLKALERFLMASIDWKISEFSKRK
ncbi:MAG: hypothetical protein JGK24_03435 [Microcoleus sp. PH2017_29_MFU_D_A]|uniref:hypothetical protein n=1 Tax=unclassified Microcoleus TaxID=2642155 RepID=UPI001DC3368A|nr:MULTISPECIES: hypothetical protein [unclassified Microcoleus]MCC3418318.1 hypothetical protein [Microcoleus sp. PH2017_07_MST_O_A]MCC3430150.1 hypothetical protein [Microcoleus sp. PH2017_04_SCI_O_A]MCC3442599.1 hypothetical protein [Microcoleus sp. PH2017_03_ELD_O_A]MCC3469783.1 hypothetical protein [Microcoleus sp. PH2017_06_SFM_O_A]MCC3506256.1 hypothetical protein [Microcoleus sp. PH2017_19_SFW_U_A]MCC3511896.1 hypothetical protein [Microcoleus sp. PH2017_17_BER_D_A]